MYCFQLTNLLLSLSLSRSVVVGGRGRGGHVVTETPAVVRNGLQYFGRCLCVCLSACAEIAISDFHITMIMVKILHCNISREFENNRNNAVMLYLFMSVFVLANLTQNPNTWR